MLVLCTFSTHAAAARDPAAPDPARFGKEIAAFEAWDRQNSFPHDAILFVGSSSIRMWQTAEAFPNLPVINRGFGGSVVSDAIHFAPRIVLKYKPRLIVFYSGDNDIASGMSADRVFEDVRGFVDLVHRELPDTRLIFLPIKPSRARWSHWPEMQQVNARVADLARSDDRLDVVDTATPLLGRDGRPQHELYLADGLHLNKKGYALWNGTLLPVLQRAMVSE